MSKSNKFDVIVIGGGPAGTSCGIELRKKNYKTCIVDKKIFPQEKLCGGLITQKTIDLLKSFDLSVKTSDFYCRISNKIEVYNSNERLNSININISYYFTDRFVFDNLLTNEYKRYNG